MDFENTRNRIMELDGLIAEEKNPDIRLNLIDENLILNKEYIEYIQKGIPVRVVFCVILSLFWFIGLFIFLPQIIVRKSRINICKDRIAKLEGMKKKLLETVQKEKETSAV